jgi:hypothetical protein
MKILIACEYSGRVREAFRKKGHDALSCDLLPTDQPGPHWQGDVRRILDYGWDMMIGFPDCTYLCVSGIHWNNRGRGWDKTEAAVEFFTLLHNYDIEKIALENPVGIISSRIRKPDQIIQPYDFGEDASKKTCLWLKNLPKLQPTKHIEPRIAIYKGKEVKRWANQCDSNQNKLGPSDDRWKERSLTYQGIANAMAEQWG